MIFKLKTLSTILKYVLLISIFIANAYNFNQKLLTNLLGFVTDLKKIFPSHLKHLNIFSSNFLRVTSYAFVFYLNEVPTPLIEITASTQTKS